MITSASLFFKVFVARNASFTTLVSARSNPATWVPPFGVEIIFTNEATVASYPFPHCIAISTPISRSISVGVICPFSSRTGTFSVYAPPPEILITSPTGSSGLKKVQNSEIPPL